MQAASAKRVWKKGEIKGEKREEKKKGEKNLDEISEKKRRTLAFENGTCSQVWAGGGDKRWEQYGSQLAVREIPHRQCTELLQEGRTRTTAEQVLHSNTSFYFSFFFIPSPFSYFYSLPNLLFSILGSYLETYIESDIFYPTCNGALDSLSIYNPALPRLNRLDFYCYKSCFNKMLIYSEVIFKDT